jgi:ABC-type hemin transport system ATPase subunit
VDAEGELSKTPGGDPRVLLGPPGSGKSMVLRHLTKVVCQRVRRDRRPALMAVYVDLRGLDARHTVTVDVLRGQLEASVATGDKTVARRLTDLLQAGLHTPRWLLLFDSLDELAAMRPAAAEECLTAVRALCDSDAAFTAVIATRDLDIVNRPAWPLLTLAPLSGAQQRTFGDAPDLAVDR